MRGLCENLFFIESFLSYRQKLHYSHSSSATMKGTVLDTVLVLAISAWAAFAVGEFRVLPLPTFSAVYAGSWGN